MNAILSQKTSLFQLLKETSISIPVIQRDYAQGRKGKEALRKNFLNSLKRALDNSSNGAVTLDFVYGGVKVDEMQPLDGQQRLTTLWLLHWYLAFASRNDNNCAGKLIEVLPKFSYKTRVSSREFCKVLCEHGATLDFSGNTKLKEQITAKPWFYTTWKQDPTINAMLRMLSGETGYTDDCIEKVFYSADYKGYLRLLLMDIDACPITFYHHKDKAFLSDDLYIKMNARGKELTDFENFKAELVKWISMPENADKAFRNRTVKNNNNIEVEHHIVFSSKLDNDWINLFWSENIEFHETDLPYYLFFKRYFLTCLLTQQHYEDFSITPQSFHSSNGTLKKIKEFRKTKLDGQEDKLREFLGSIGLKKDIRETDNYDGLKERLQSIDRFYSVFANLYNEDDNEFYDFADYEFVLTLCPYILDELESILDCYSTHSIAIVKALIPTWNKRTNETSSDKAFHFIGRYTEPDKALGISQNERIVFAALCQYLKNGEYDDKLFKEWMRVVWNIATIAGIRDVPPMIDAMRHLSTLDQTRVYYSLRQKAKDFEKDDAIEAQLNLECLKAKLILIDEGFENEIIKSECSPIFKGNNRFLFQQKDISSLKDTIEDMSEEERNEFASLKNTFVSRVGVAMEFLQATNIEDIVWRALIAKTNSTPEWSFSHGTQNEGWQKLCNKVFIQELRNIIDEAYRSHTTFNLTCKAIAEAYIQTDLIDWKYVTVHYDDFWSSWSYDSPRWLFKYYDGVVYRYCKTNKHKELDLDIAPTREIKRSEIYDTYLELLEECNFQPKLKNNWSLHFDFTDNFNRINFRKTKRNGVYRIDLVKRTDEDFYFFEVFNCDRSKNDEELNELIDRNHLNGELLQDKLQEEDESLRNYRWYSRNHLKEDAIKLAFNIMKVIEEQLP